MTGTVLAASFGSPARRVHRSRLGLWVNKKGKRLSLEITLKKKKKSYPTMVQ
jgi:hypothetical protein